MNYSCRFTDQTCKFTDKTRPQWTGHVHGGTNDAVFYGKRRNDDIVFVLFYGNVFSPIFDNMRCIMDNPIFYHMTWRSYCFYRKMFTDSHVIIGYDRRVSWKNAKNGLKAVISYYLGHYGWIFDINNVTKMKYSEELVRLAYSFPVEAQYIFLDVQAYTINLENKYGQRKRLNCFKKFCN